MRISDWSSDVCSSDPLGGALLDGVEHQIARQRDHRIIDRVGHVANGGPGPQLLYGLATWIDRIDRGRKDALSAVEQGAPESGRAHVWTPVTTATLSRRPLTEKKKSVYRTEK